MDRRTYLIAGGALVTAGAFGRVGGTQDEDEAGTIACAGAVADADDGGAGEGEEGETSDDEAETEPIVFEGSGVEVTDEFDLEGGLVVAEGTHEGESNFIVDLVGAERDRSVFNVIGGYEGAAGGLYDRGEYRLDVDADGAWTITIRRPRPDEDDAEPLPQTLECEGATWAGPYLFEGLTEVTGMHEGESNFIVEVFVAEGRFPELVFNEIGPFEGETTLRAEGVGYVITEADGPWTVEMG